MISKASNAILCPILGLILCAVVAPGTAGAVDYFWTGGTSSWNGFGNWDQGLVPEASFEEVGIINNGGTATLNTVAMNTQAFNDGMGVVPGAVAGLILGQGEGESGALHVQSGGVINFVDSSGVPDGTANIGLGGTGILEVQGGGSFGATFLDVNAGSRLTIGEGAGAASVVVSDTMWLNGTTTMHGAGHTFMTSGDVFLEGQGAYAPVISANGSAGISTLSTSGTLNLQGGGLNVSFSGGYSPAPGDSWILADAANVTGAIGAINVASATPGQVYRLRTMGGGANGQLLQLELETALVLTYDWDTGSLSMSSPSGAPIDIDGYSILSSTGSLNPGQWNSLQDQAVSGWLEAFPAADALNELNSNAGGTLSVGATPFNLGTPFTPVIGPFGTPVEEVTFEYTTPGSGIIDGIIEHTGNRIVNNLLLTVDPSTGEAQLKNSSLTTIAIDGYSVLSDSGSLLASNGNWSSLEDQSEGDWEEATPSATELSELNPLSSSTLLPGQGFSLGNLFDHLNGEQDLTLEFLLVGQPGIQSGIVDFGEIIPFLTGDADFNDSGAVNGLDFLAWQLGKGITAGATLADGDANGDGAVNGTDLAVWRSQYGVVSPVSAVATVPEPTSFVLLLAAGLVLARGRKCRGIQELSGR